MVNLLSTKSKFSTLKKVLFPIVFSFALVLCFPQSTLGATMEITVTITSVIIPERSAMILASDRPNTEFRLAYGRIVVTQGVDGPIKGQKSLTDGSSYDYLVKNKVAVFLFAYDDTLAPYNVYAEALVNQDKLCNADCSTADPTAYYFQVAPGYLSGSTWKTAKCPDLICGAPYDYLQYLSVDSVRIFETAAGDFYWRSLALFTIN